MTMAIKTYSEMIQFDAWEDRLRYLMLHGKVYQPTFGEARWLNQVLYHNAEWRHARDEVIIRDNGCDLGSPEMPIHSKILVHHMNPITKEDVLERNPDIFNPEYLITVCHATHSAIHYSDEAYLRQFTVTVRQPNDTIPWR